MQKTYLFLHLLCFYYYFYIFTNFVTFLRFTKTPQNVLVVPRVWGKTKYAIWGDFKFWLQTTTFCP